MILDDTAAVRRIDRSNILSVMEKTPERLAPPSDADSTCHIEIEAPENVVFGGVGGSGIVGDILADYCRSELELPAVVCRSVNIPGFVGRSTLFIAISYSGETGETLSMLEQAERKGAYVAAVCSGGKLLSSSQAQSLPCVRVMHGMLPRLALPELLAAVTYVMGKANVFEDSRRLLEETARVAKEQISSVGVSVPLGRNMAKQMATALPDRLPLLIGSEENVSVLRRLKNELNENSKVPAFYFTLPEAYHDDIEGLSALKQFSQPQPILLRNQHESEGDEKTRRKLVELLSELGFHSTLEFTGIGTGRLQWLFSAILFGDYVSTYLAILRSVDPSELFLIPKFRAIRGQV